MKKEQFDKSINFIYPIEESHKNREGKTVYHYSYNLFKDSFNFQMDAQAALKGEILLTGTACFEFFNLEYLVNLSYCEGDVYAVFFETEKELKEAIKSTMQYYEENEGYQYDMTEDDFFKQLRKKQIIRCKFQEMYTLFLFECESEPMPGSDEWKNNVAYIDWVSKMNLRFKKENNIPTNADITFYLGDRSKWIKKQLERYL